MVVTGLAAADVTSLTQSITQAELRWLRTIVIGLFGFLIYSLAALQVTLIMPVGSFELGAMNFPGPKLNGTTPIQRAIGGQPGQWGVAGTMAMLFQVAAIWLLTERRTLRGTWEPTFTVRSAARWVSILAAGALLGAALSGAGEFIPPMSDGCGGFLICAIVLCELPANALIYLHLRRLAEQLGNKRAELLLRVCVWMVPALTLGGAMLIGIDIARHSPPDSLWHLVTSGYGATAVATSAAATAAVGYLLATTMAAGFGGWISRLPAHLRQGPALIRRAVEMVEQSGPRWCVVTGLLLWLGMLPFSATDALWRSGRAGFMGDVPMFNFIGPKVMAPVVNFEMPYYYQDASSAILTQITGLAAVWLMTTAPSQEKSGRRLRRMARWAATLAVAMPLGMRLGYWWKEADASYLTAFAVCCETPATILLYLYLAQIASSAGESAKKIRWICAAITVAAAMPLMALVLGKAMHSDRHNPIWAGVGGIEIAASLSLTFIAASTLLQLTWVLFRHAVGFTSPPEPAQPPLPA
jgi:hypothetical protein